MLRHAVMTFGLFFLLSGHFDGVAHADVYQLGPVYLNFVAGDSQYGGNVTVIGAFNGTQDFASFGCGSAVAYIPASEKTIFATALSAATKGKPVWVRFKTDATEVTMPYTATTRCRVVTITFAGN